MNFALFFQKHDRGVLNLALRKIYYLFGLRTNKQKIKFLRDSGAKIGENVWINSISMFGSEPYLIEVGDNTYFAGGKSYILTHDGGVGMTYNMGLVDKAYDYFGCVKIGKNCFIGINSIIMKHVTIGDNCIIGAGSVVTKSIPSNSVAAGCPAKVICTVEEFVEKNKARFDLTLGWNTYEKRKYIEKNMFKYEEWRKEREIQE